MVAAEAELAIDCRCTLGEGILWCTRREVLFWSDILASRLWMYSPGSRVTRTWSLPDRLGSLALCESGRLLLALAKGLYLADVPTDVDELPPFGLLVLVENDEPRTRINDGRCDRSGNFVFGTMNEHAAREPIGCFYQFSCAYGLRRLDLPGVAIPNSLCFSPDATTMYWCDSAQPRILCCDYDSGSAHTAHIRVFATLTADTSCADGSTVDAEGFLWNAQWGAGRVVRYSPEGKIDCVVPLPAKNPTCIALGGRQLNELYITTARAGLSSTDLSEQPESGGLYRWHSPVKGLPESQVAQL